MLVDNADFDMLNQWKWSLHTEGYAVRYSKRKAIWMHREIVGVLRGMLPDHIDGNPLNNQRANLRFVTPAQNTWNTKKADGTTSQYKGVSWHKTKKRWQAQIMKHGKSYHLGHFTTEIAAAQAYAAMKKDLHGEFGRPIQIN